MREEAKRALTEAAYYDWAAQSPRNAARREELRTKSREAQLAVRRQFQEARGVLEVSESARAAELEQLTRAALMSGAVRAALKANGPDVLERLDKLLALSIP